MLDVHPAHHAASTWRDFFIHIATIVIGLLIAVGLEQTVEYFHHRHQREELTAALQRDCEANRGYIDNDIASAQAVSYWAIEQASVLEHAKPGGPLTIRRMPHANLGSPDAGVWPSAKASGTTNLLPASAQNWLEYLNEYSNETFVSSSSAMGELFRDFAALDRTILGEATQTSSGDLDLSTLTPAQRSAAADCMRGIAEQARALVQRLVTYDASNEYILSTPFDQLDSVEAEKRYEKILAQKRKDRPEAGFLFAGN
jgi:hypothetical protein